eukprot:TRINITY_DN12327_c0_g1_i1.p1 TRINITY_DN12327_c0_g1~~TRINITY_DN12327_c0_g1_i1.p1  ORF type:complete len:133 (+),score=31.64 TRINITY_DN12327_c0_g1_i1:36-434(+)
MIRSSAVLHYSRDLTVAKQRSVALYRRCLKEAPEIIRNYRLTYTVEEVRKKMKQHFRENAHVTDPIIIDSLVLKGENQLEECRMNWATRSHVLRFFVATKDPEIETVKLSNLNEEEKKVLEKFFAPPKETFQ